MSIYNRFRSFFNLALTIVGVAFFGLCVIALVQYVREDKLSGTSFSAKVSYDSIGTTASRATVSSTYAGTASSTHLAKEFNTLQLDVAYNTVSTTIYSLILVEVSNDEGTTFYPISIPSSTTNESLVYTEDSSGVSGIPYTFPGDKTAPTSTVTYGTIKVTNLVADVVRISAKKSSAAAATTSTLSVRTSLSNQ